MTTTDGGDQSEKGMSTSMEIFITVTVIIVTIGLLVGLLLVINLFAKRFPNSRFGNWINSWKENHAHSDE